MASESQSESPVVSRPTKQRRRVLQFSLLSLLLLCSFCAIVAAWIANRAADYRRQNEARKKVEEPGGSVEVKTAWPKWVARIVGGEPWQEVTAVTFEPVGFYSVDGMHGSQMPLVNEETIRKLSAFRKLERLYIESAELSDDSMQRVAELRSLESLSLPSSKLTDAGVDHLATLPNLKVLDLRGNAISDAALEYLAAMTSLESLDLRGTQITPAALERLQRALPKCRIEFTVVDDPLGPAP